MKRLMILVFVLLAVTVGSSSSEKRHAEKRNAEDTLMERNADIDNVAAEKRQRPPPHYRRHGE